MNVKDILIKKITELGGDGLFNPGGECGCGIDDLQPCSDDCMDCVPAQSKVVDGELLYFELNIKGV